MGEPNFQGINDNEPSEEVFVNKVSRKLFVFVEQLPHSNSARMIDPNGLIRIFDLGIFEEESFDVRTEQLSSEQNTILDRLQREEEGRAITSFQSTLGTEPTYEMSRLTFLRRFIDPLGMNDYFVIKSRLNGTFRMTKKDFYEVFSNVAESDSYLIKGNYNYNRAPEKSLQFRVHS